MGNDAKTCTCAICAAAVALAPVGAGATKNELPQLEMPAGNMGSPERPAPPRELPPAASSTFTTTNSVCFETISTDGLDQIFRSDVHPEMRRTRRGTVPSPSGERHPAKFSMRKSEWERWAGSEPAPDPKLPPKTSWPTSDTGEVSISKVDANLDVRRVTEPPFEVRRPKRGTVPST
jgi:hypothetical protein